MLASECIDNILKSFPDHSASTITGFKDIESCKEILLTLHALFPNILLPALDVLDRRLVTRLDLSEHKTSTEQVSSTPREEAARHKNPQIYYVRSTVTDHPSTRGRVNNFDPDAPSHYEVHPVAWSCTCASFAYAVFHGSDDTPKQSHANSVVEALENVKEGRLGWGGLLQPYGGNDVPTCKHLLACVLAERWTGAGSLVGLKSVKQEEIAAWAAGWRD